MTDDERAEVEAQEAAENTEPEAAPAEDEEIEEEPIQLRGETKTCPVCKAEVDGDACSATTVCSAVKYGRAQLLQKKRCQHLTNPAICVK